ncbi:MAG: [protein-PII] uridylyltransferase [Acidobacteria bacterium]|nr:[protein-PII] uridylyltransferase [Acidobacteriota bacterium]
MSGDATCIPKSSEQRRRHETDLEAARREIFEGIRRGESGRHALNRFSGRVDRLIRRIFAAAQQGTQPPAAVVAMGGYGRRQLCPYSDIDLLVLFDRKIGPEGEALLRSLLHPLWDLRLDLGHQVREISDFEQLEKDNAEFLLALLDARLVAGDAALFRRLQQLFRRSGPTCSRQLLDALLPLVEVRHARFNDTCYQLEPDIKEAPGTLRDVIAGRWISSLARGRLSGGRRRVAAGSDPERVDQAEDFLLRIRVLLHQESGRNRNILTHPLQERIAEMLGYPGTQPRQRVERLMGDYFRHARVVARSLEAARRTANSPLQRGHARRAGHNLERLGDAIRFRDPLRAAADPASWLQPFLAAIEQQCRVSDATLSLIERNLQHRRPEELLPTQRERDLLLSFLSPRPGLYGRLSEMHDCGLLGRIFPEFGAIACRVIRDFYHKYTVDEHTLLAIRSLEQLADPSSRGRERFRSLLQEVPSPELLVLSLLLHDVGKWKDESHVQESARMAQRVFRRLDLPEEAAALVQFLIENHLQMSLAALRRDTEDAEVVRRFAALVGTELNLKMLCLLTLVDISAVSPETLTPWKEELLWRLYVDTYNHLTLAYADEVIARDLASVHELLAGRPEELSESEISSFLEGFPRRYLKSVSRESIYRHVRLSRDMRPDAVHLSLEKRKDVWEISVVTLDKPYLFSKISGVLSYFGMDILRGQAMTSPAGLVLDIFQFTDHEKFLQMNPEGAEQLEQTLQDVVAGRVELSHLLQRKEQGALDRKTPRRVPTLIHFDDQFSQRYSILEIITQDALGLLYRISRIISRHGYDIDLVLISTEGDRAIDVFHITGKEGKLAAPAQEELKASLQSALEGIYEADQEHRSAGQS